MNNSPVRFNILTASFNKRPDFASSTPCHRDIRTKWSACGFVGHPLSFHKLLTLIHARYSFSTPASSNAALIRCRTTGKRSAFTRLLLLLVCDGGDGDDDVDANRMVRASLSRHCQWRIRMRWCGVGIVADTGGIVVVCPPCCAVGFVFSCNSV